MAFSVLVKNYYQSWFRFHPEQAVAVGEEGYETLLTPYSDDEIGALISLNQSLLTALQELDQSELSAAEKMDFNILYSATANEIHELLEADWRYRNPEKFLPVNAIYQLLTRPVKHFHDAIQQRLEAIPAYLRGARLFLRQKPELIPADWLASAKTQAFSGVEFLLNLDQHPVVVKRFDNPRRIQQQAESASHALKDFAVFLENEIEPLVKGDFACGRATFDRLLKEMHFLPLDADALYLSGQRLFEQTREQLQQILGDKTLQQALSEIRTNVPGKNELLDVYRKSIQRAQAFICDHDLVSVPLTQTLSVVETPGFLRHEIPFAAYDDPVRNDPRQHGHYYVTLPQNEEALAEHNRISIDLTSVHEAYPGHHLQFSTANLTAGANSLVRVLNATATFYEGWALYCEELMVEQGYLDKPEHRVIMLRDRLWRALRIMIDVDIQTRGLSLDEAAGKLVESLGFEPEQARGELNWYSFAPTVPMSYATGWAMIRACREVLEQFEDFNLKAFHDALLAEGAVPLPLVIAARFGETVWQQVRDKVFGSQ